jgi:hypothetical protein
MFNLRIKSKMHQYTQLLLLILLIGINAPVIAQQLSECPQAEVRATNGQVFIFWEHEFDHGVHDLVISKPDKSDIKRVTYSGKSTLEKSGVCTYKALAIAQGSDWGWHLAWTFNEKTGVFYSRMDGVAWVSTPPMRIEKGTADALKFDIKGEQVILNGYVNQNGESTAFKLNSDDEGRNW